MDATDYEQLPWAIRIAAFDELDRALIDGLPGNGRARHGRI
jgi:hypothetical protein